MTDMDVSETAKQLGVSERTIRRWLREGRLDGYKVGGRIRIPERAVREAAAPYGTDPGTEAGAKTVPSAGHETDEMQAGLLALFDDPVRKAAALRRRRELAAAKMDEIRARSRPSSGPDDTAEAYIREDREERDRHWDEILGLDRP